MEGTTTTGTAAWGGCSRRTERGGGEEGWDVEDVEVVV